ncbi:hypothetical protein MA5S0422_2847 [Mycobacteroides abscessus 5S-0422]|nr:hypothetical protein MA5S0421_2164 [Mycobacteroides abscessus 5S-0421]EIU13069.1 hypothetical protein MA5S0422_2847 [Mycobacteroides abscessus 5S-0422]EIU43165.1 hypothetical protein MA5S1215_4959 [Mycobacteroides abscessus 5S-1215]EIU92612.1 hypothetical protein MA5S0921_2644 [Mycobacteroides abscessus 5S-0921]
MFLAVHVIAAIRAGAHIGGIHGLRTCQESDGPTVGAL